MDDVDDDDVEEDDYDECFGGRRTFGVRGIAVVNVDGDFGGWCRAYVVVVCWLSIRLFVVCVLSSVSPCTCVGVYF
jgi:hypothetical protein